MGVKGTKQRPIVNDITFKNSSFHHYFRCEWVCVGVYSHMIVKFCSRFELFIAILAGVHKCSWEVNVFHMFSQIASVIAFFPTQSTLPLQGTRRFLNVFVENLAAGRGHTGPGRGHTGWNLTISACKLVKIYFNDLCEWYWFTWWLRLFLVVNVLSQYLQG